jgi:uncharacterized RDD family membrane protein YckC
MTFDDAPPLADQCRYCCQPLEQAQAAWCPVCKSRLQPLSLLPEVKGFARLGARFLDVCLFEALIALIVLPLLWIDPGNTLLMVYVKLCGFLGLFTALPLLEATCLTHWGATPGKWLMRLEVVGPGQTLPTWKQAIGRTLRLYHRLGYFMAGLSLVFMLVMAVNRQESAVMLLLAVMGLVLIIGHVRTYWHYRQSGGHTHWDESQGLRVNHRVLRFERVMVALLSYLLLSAATQIVARGPEVMGQGNSVL